MPTESRRRWLRWLLQALVLVAIVWGVQLYRARDAVSGLAPDFALQPLAGGELVGPAALSGRPALIYFWATWCPVCKVERGNVAAVAGEHAVLSVAAFSGSVAEVEQHVRANDIRFPVVVDETGAVASRYGVRGVPAGYYLDGDGRVRFVTVGYTSELGMRLRLWLAGR